MSSSVFCIEQRQKEQQRSQKLIILGLFGSVVLHTIGGVAIVALYERPTVANDPIELIIVEEPPPPKPKELPKPKPTPPPRIIKPAPKINQPKPIEKPQVIPTPVNNPIPKAQPKTVISKAPQPVKPEVTNTPIPEPQITPEPVSELTPIPEPTVSEPITPTTIPSTLTTTQKGKPVFNSPTETNTNTAVNETVLENPVATVPSSLSSNQWKPSQVAPLSSNNSQQREQIKTGLNTTSAAPNDDNNKEPTSLNVPRTVSTNNKPPERPEPQAKKQEAQELRCLSQCQPSYPSALNGVEGSATVRLDVDSNGNVISATLSRANPNSQVNQQALLAARKMKFTQPNGERGSVQITVHFTVAGSDFDRQARERREQQERQRQAQEQQRRERQAQLEQERQQRQQQLEQQRRERQAQLEQERQQRQEQTEPESPLTETNSLPD